VNKTFNDFLIALPSFGAIWLYLLSIPVEKWASVAGLVFIVVQLAHKVWAWRNERADRKRQGLS
jgi:hypothetical protein